MRLLHPRHATAFRWLLVVALIVTTWQTLTPNPIPVGEGDKLAHAGAFLLLAFLADAAWPARPLGWRALLLLTVYGAAIELAQHYVPNRFMSLGDMIANLTGLGLYAALIGPRLRRRDSES